MENWKKVGQRKNGEWKKFGQSKHNGKILVGLRHLQKSVNSEPYFNGLYLGFWMSLFDGFTDLLKIGKVNKQNVWLISLSTHSLWT